jgi:hypothetical protein
VSDAQRLLEHRLRFAVRSYEVDENGQVNNALAGAARRAAASE